MTIYDGNKYQVKITQAKEETFTAANVIVSEWYVVAVYNDPRLSSRLNGQRCGHPTRMEKALSFLKADGGKEEIIKECQRVCKG